jgi:hypothetical protein
LQSLFLKIDIKCSSKNVAPRLQEARLGGRSGEEEGEALLQQVLRRRASIMPGAFSNKLGSVSIVATSAIITTARTCAPVAAPSCGGRRRMIHIEAQIPTKISGPVLTETCTIEFAYEVSNPR